MSADNNNLINENYDDDDDDDDEPSRITSRHRRVCATALAL